MITWIKLQNHPPVPLGSLQPSIAGEVVLVVTAGRGRHLNAQVLQVPLWVLSLVIVTEPNALHLTVSN